MQHRDQARKRVLLMKQPWETSRASQCQKPGWSRLQKEKMGENWEIARINNLCGVFSVKGQRNEGASGAKESVCILR